jgi:hypothetical protein
LLELGVLARQHDAHAADADHLTEEVLARDHGAGRRQAAQVVRWFRQRR